MRISLKLLTTVSKGLQTRPLWVGEVGKTKTTRVLPTNEAQAIRRIYMRFRSAISPSVSAVSPGKRSCRNTFPLPGVDMQLWGKLPLSWILDSGFLIHGSQLHMSTFQLAGCQESFTEVTLVVAETS